MRARRWFESRFFIVGATLLVLGAGNALIGSRKLAEYQALVAEGRARGYFPDAGGADDILRPLDEEGEEYRIGRAKIDLYHVILSGGLMMTGVGLVLTVAAWVRLRIRNDPRPTVAPATARVRRA
jgi:hypothetical protein